MDYTFGVWLIFGCESSPISRNVSYLVSLLTEGPRSPKRTQKDPAWASMQRQTGQTAFAALSFSSWFHLNSRKGRQKTIQQAIPQFLANSKPLIN